MHLSKMLIVALAAFALIAAPAQADPLDLSVNGGFETGTFDGWELFPTGPDQFTIVTPGSDSDNAGCIENSAAASAALMKNANIGIGVVEPNQMVTISFDARGEFGPGGVAFAEFFSELDGGGVSASEILGGAPLALDPDPSVWKSFSFTAVTGPDVSGGVTLQLTATTAADGASFANVCYDNIRVIVEVPVSSDESSWGIVKGLYR